MTSIFPNAAARRAALLMTVLLAVAFVAGYATSCDSGLQERYAAEQRARTIAEANALAAADSTRELHGVVETMRAFERLAWQLDLQRDSLDRALRQQSAARLAAELRVDELEAIVAGSNSEDTSGVRVAAIEHYAAPFTVKAAVTVPPPPAGSDWHIRVALDPIPIGVRIGCRETAAVTQLITPPWAVGQLTHVEQDEDVCNPEPRVVNRPRSFTKRAGCLGAGAGSVGLLLVDRPIEALTLGGLALLFLC